MPFLPLLFRFHMLFLYIHSFHDYFSSAGITLVPCRFCPLSLPAITFTISPFFIFINFLHHFRRQGNYLIIPLFLNFSRNQPKILPLMVRAWLCPKARRHSRQTGHKTRPSFGKRFSAGRPKRDGLLFLNHFSRFGRLNGNNDNFAQLSVSFLAPAEHFENLD